MFLAFLVLILSRARLLQAHKKCRRYIRHYRALAYQVLNRPDQARAEYIAIYPADPDSAWVLLAALHLEPAA